MFTEWFFTLSSGSLFQSIHNIRMESYESSLQRVHKAGNNLPMAKAKEMKDHMQHSLNNKEPQEKRRLKTFQPINLHALT